MNQFFSGKVEGNSMPRGQIISCLKAGKMIEKGYLYNVVRVKDLNVNLILLIIPCSERFPRSFS